MATPEHASRKHALLSASGASRWINCTPSPRLEEDFGKDNESSYAAEGTLAHEFGDLGLQLAAKRITVAKYNKAAKAYRENELYSPEMPDEVAKYIGYVMEQYKVAKKKVKGTELLIEEKIDLTYFIENGFGTCDANIISDGTLEVVDLKYGKGIRVSAEDNDQLKLYGLGALRKYDLSYDIDTIRLTIVQPRLDHISSWEISAKDLFAWGERIVKPKAKMAYVGEGETCVGVWCRWCKVKPRCKALADQNLAIAKQEFADPQLLSDEELIEAYKQMPSLTDWVNSVAAYLLKEALDGKKWPGHKLVEGRSNRKWVNEKDVADKLNKSYDENQYLNIKLKGIGDIEKLVGKADFSTLLGPFVVKPPGKPTLVDESDKRPALWNEQAKEDFK